MDIFRRILHGKKQHADDDKYDVSPLEDLDVPEDLDMNNLDTAICKHVLKVAYRRIDEETATIIHVYDEILEGKHETDHYTRGQNANALSTLLISRYGIINNKFFPPHAESLIGNYSDQNALKSWTHGLLPEIYDQEIDRIQNSREKYVSHSKLVLGFFQVAFNGIKSLHQVEAQGVKGAVELEIVRLIERKIEIFGELSESHRSLVNSLHQMEKPIESEGKFFSSYINMHKQGRKIANEIGHKFADDKHLLDYASSTLETKKFKTKHTLKAAQAIKDEACKWGEKTLNELIIAEIHFQHNMFGKHFDQDILKASKRDRLEELDKEEQERRNQS